MSSLFDLVNTVSSTTQTPMNNIHLKPPKSLLFASSLLSTRNFSKSNLLLNCKFDWKNKSKSCFNFKHFYSGLQSIVLWQKTKNHHPLLRNSRSFFGAMQNWTCFFFTCVYIYIHVYTHALPPILIKLLPHRLIFSILYIVIDLISN